ncbi:carbohydrate ABC transporter permease [Aestuariivirga sp. YIM B02566]|uniref:Carbohydrate ABC transporter permease n=1 Tax=Taklimakanibacter albus TaxID=2800327 RepID=A0ACC5R6X2_9HYPH|nr:carbohydrate ABC transporter permease [Aestuariivirga sp. YIM B02566]MBK1868392.1 carbohydrate ABC transporter permease [Aestuariivirga sp. YIM B02566]
MTPLVLLRRFLFYALVAAILFYTVFPFYWAIVSSLKSGSAIFRVEFLPAAPTLENYRALFAEQSFARNIVNSLFVASVATAISLALGVTAAYALGRIKFRGRAAILFAVLSISMFPQIAVLSGLFELIRAAGLYNSLTGLIFSNLILTLPFTTWVLTAFLRELPRELEDSAVMDCASSFRIMTEIFLPLMAPALAATGLLAFILAWNEFLFALTFTLSNEKRTVPVAIALITGASAYELPWGRVMAASVIVTAPLIALVLLLQRHIVSGLVAGAVKG